MEVVSKPYKTKDFVYLLRESVNNKKSNDDIRTLKQFVAVIQHVNKIPFFISLEIGFQAEIIVFHYQARISKVYPQHLHLEEWYKRSRRAGRRDQVMSRQKIAQLSLSQSSHLSSRFPYLCGFFSIMYCCFKVLS